MNLKRSMASLPEVGFSLLSANALIEQNISPNESIAYRSWTLPGQLEWTKSAVKQGDYLRILVQFEENRFGVRFRMNLCKATPSIYYNLPEESSTAIYLAVAASEIFDDEDACCISLYDTAQLSSVNSAKRHDAVLRFSDSLDADALSGALTEAKTLNPKVDDEMGEGVRTCSFCCESPVEVILLPCGHAPCCRQCMDRYVVTERNKSHTVLGRAASSSTKKDVLCPICRKKLEYTALIWFKHEKCLICGCGKMNAVAGGRGGCGCVFGCYDKAVQQYKTGMNCPSCGDPIVEIIQAYIDCDID